MKIRLLSEKAAPARTALLVGLAFDGTKPALSARVEDDVAKAKATGDLTTGFRKTALFYPASRGGPKRLLFVGMGKRGEVTAERLRQAAAIAQERAEDLGVDEFQLWVAAEDHGAVDAAAAGCAIAEGLVLGAYRYEPARRKKPEVRKAQRAVVVQAGAHKKAFADGLQLGLASSEGTVLARELGNKPANECTPRFLAAEAKKLARAGLRVQVFDESAMRRHQMGALLGVARGSSEPARLIVLDHKPAGAKRTVCVVGKGLTFDSGGISIKPAAKMDEMRYDMCGGSAVLGLFRAIRAGALSGAHGKTRVVGVVAACENMPSDRAQKPGDVVRACNGTTIEVLNTDAEGRLVLADALAWACKTYEPDGIVDIATLTGAVIVALGHEATGILGNDEAFVRGLIDAGERAGEPLWQLPLWDVHKEQMKSKFADLANINAPGHGGGTIAGAAFLSNFVGDTPWAHLDIAGTAWGARSRDYYRAGATGAPVRTLVRWLRSL